MHHRPVQKPVPGLQGNKARGSARSHLTDCAVFTAHMDTLRRKITDKMFQPVQPGSIYAGGSQTKCMGKTALTVKAGVAYRHQSDICGAGDAKCF